MNYLPEAKVSIYSELDLPQVYLVNQKNGEGKIRNVSARLITDDEIDLGQV